MNIHNITIDGPLKHIMNEDDSIEIMFMKAFLALQLLRTFIFGIKVYGLYFIYHFVLKSGFKELPNIKYIQFCILIISIEMAKYIISDSLFESEKSD